MNGKKLLVVFLSLFMVFSFTSCREDDTVNTTQSSQEITTTPVTEGMTQFVSENILSTETAVYVVPSSTVTETLLSTSQETSGTTESQATEPVETTTEPNNDPSGWSKERIVEEYKTAARKSNATAKSNQSIVLKEISVNNGEYEEVFSFIKPIISKFLESNSTEKDGITGGYENLVPSDVASAKAYKNGDNIAIEMVMVEQTSGAREDALSGSVGHAITAVGDISEVTGQLSDLGLSIEISENDTKIYYTNPVVKVLINSDGEIVSGTWSYTVEISLNNFKAFGKTVDTASIVMENTITV